MKPSSLLVTGASLLWLGTLSHAQSQTAITPVIPDAARPLPLSAVRLTGGPLKKAQDLDAEYLLKLEPDRMMAYFRRRAGLEGKAEPYGGWDGDGKNLTGHIAGHYLSAVSLMWAATGESRFKERADYIVQEMKEVQDKHGDGYLGALANGKERFAEVASGNIRSGGFDLNGLWSPWYVLHKIYAGLRDAYRHTGNRTALELEIKFAAWAEGILARLNDTQVQRMLNTEFGGMNEIFADLYADTGDRRWLNLSYRFEHHAMLDPLKRHQDNLAGKHGNTQVPKLMGSLARFAYTGDPGDGFAAAFFWDRVAQHHSYATGGHSKDEHFGEPDKLSDRVDGRTAETCNVYNMLKMTRRLFALRPDIIFADFQERSLFNHILGSIDPEDGRTCYMVPVGRGVQHEYHDMMRSFTCCVGSGMESHALHGDGIYFESGNRLWINLYVPSTAEWKSAGASLTMNTDFPEGESATLKLKLASPRELMLALRRPFWAGEGFTVKVNGEAVADLPKAGSYVELKRTWKDSDEVALALPKTLHLEPLPDNPRRVAVLWGPLVLAGDLGPERERGRGRGSRFQPLDSVPVFVAAERPVTDWLKPVPDQAGRFRSEGVGREKEVEFVPFYRLHRRTYA
ncbi:MAG: glycoside hydrolase family 127 protein, partial [Chloroflexi bacterium]|nr:glycoside hydrolase family 127 protein [Chloroflexota bacterium]